jgi:regulator of replication initiation timing
VKDDPRSPGQLFMEAAKKQMSKLRDVGELRGRVQVLEEENARLVEENLSLREALREIADDKCSKSTSLIERINAMEDKARAALASTEAEGEE